MKKEICRLGSDGSFLEDRDKFLEVVDFLPSGLGYLEGCQTERTFLEPVGDRFSAILTVDNHETSTNDERELFF